MTLLPHSITIFNILFSFNVKIYILQVHQVVLETVETIIVLLKEIKKPAATATATVNHSELLPTVVRNTNKTTLKHPV